MTKKRRERNPVAKNMNTYNKPQTHKDKKKMLKKGVTKHKKMRYDENMPLAA